MIKILNQECYKYWKDSLENYEDTKHLAVFQITPQRSEDIRESLLAYRRAHNIFEVGDKVIRLDLPSAHIYSVQKIGPDLITIVRKKKSNAVKTWGAWVPPKELRHATGAEIATEMCLPQVGLEVLRDCDIPPNTIILGDE